MKISMSFFISLSIFLGSCGHFSERAPLSRTFDINDILSEENVNLRPNKVVINYWLENFPFSSTKELWLFLHKNELSQIVQKHEELFSDPSIYQQLLNLKLVPVGDLDPPEIFKLKEIYPITRSQMFSPLFGVLVPQSLALQVPHEILQKIQAIQIKLDNKGLWWSFPNKSLANNHLISHGLAPEHLNKFVFETFNSFIINVTSSNWKFFPKELKEKLFQQKYSHYDKYYKYKKISLDIDQDIDFYFLNPLLKNLHTNKKDYTEVIKEFRRSNPKAKKIPFKYFLDGFIKENINQFTSCEQFNCFKSIFRIHFTSRELQGVNFYLPDNVTEFIHENYEKIEESDGGKPGDILFFIGPKGKPLHIVFYLIGPYVFTKNGPGPFAPFSIQHIDDIKETYSGKTNFIIPKYYRKKNKMN